VVCKALKEEHGQMNRRSLFAFAAVALAEMRITRAAEKECVHDHHCGPGRVCVEGICQGTSPCVGDTDCTSPAVCREGICVTIEVTSGGVTLVQPVTVNLLRRKRRRRRKGHRRR
jgi:hypothetical protein